MGGSFQTDVFFLNHLSVTISCSSSVRSPLSVSDDISSSACSSVNMRFVSTFEALSRLTRRSWRRFRRFVSSDAVGIGQLVLFGSISVVVSGVGLEIASICFRYDSVSPSMSSSRN